MFKCTRCQKELPLVERVKQYQAVRNCCIPCYKEYGKSYQRRKPGVTRKGSPEHRDKISRIIKGIKSPEHHVILTSTAQRVKLSTEERKERNTESARRKRRERKEADIIAHGGSCSCCGESRLVILAITHNEDVTEVMCYNCTMAKGFYGECNHQRGRC